MLLLFSYQKEWFIFLFTTENNFKDLVHTGNGKNDTPDQENADDKDRNPA